MCSILWDLINSILAPCTLLISLAILVASGIFSSGEVNSNMDQEVRVKGFASRPSDLEKLSTILLIRENCSEQESMKTLEAKQRSVVGLDGNAVVVTLVYGGRDEVIYSLPW